MGDFLLLSGGKTAIIRHFYKFSKNNYIKTKDIPMEKPYLCPVKSFYHTEQFSKR